MLIIGLLLFALLVVVHEFGHYLMARRAGVEVEEFGIGFPPRLFGFKKAGSKTLYSINLLPLGGFVKLKGEADEDKRSNSFGRARLSQKAGILVAGVGMNLLAAFAFLLILALTGLPKIFPGQFSIAGNEKVTQQRVLVGEVLEGTPAAQAGLVLGDELMLVDGRQIHSAQQLIDYTRARPEQTVNLTVSHQGQEKQVHTNLSHNEQGQGLLGLVPIEDVKTRYSWAAPVVAAVLTLQLTWLTLAGIASLIAGLISQGTASEAVAGTVGPVGILALLQNAGELGFAYVLLLIVIISVSLAVVNLLPIPALDGGRLALISVFRLLKKPLPKRIENAVHGTGFALLLILVAIISYFDVRRFF